ncbi:MAG: RecX family transcriptional regulator [Parachlamydiales bacterium]|nr:RecX family transcriptional regulator [Parachlamydiales bacterium]
MDYSAARKRALWLLSKRNYHSEVLQRKLMEKGCSEEVAGKVVADCRRMGILSDEDAILRELRRGWGPRAIEFKLRLGQGEVRKTISREMQKARILEMIPKLGPREKAFRTLMRKGFDSELIIEIFSCRD